MGVREKVRPAIFEVSAAAGSGKADTRRRPSQSGATAIQLLVILVPVVFGLMGFAIDLGRLYLARAELKTAANAMALAAAGQMIGTESGLTEASAAAQLTLENSAGLANRYDFGGITIGGADAFFQSQVQEPLFYDTVAAAIGTDGAAGGEAGGAAARHVRINITAEAPLFFWNFLPLVVDRKTQLQVQAVAGMSAPLCMACGIEPIAIAPADAADTVDFGFVVNTRYTLGYQCTAGGGAGGGTPAPLPGTTQRIPYLILDRLNEEAQYFPEEPQQLYRAGAAGLPGSVNEAQSCIKITAADAETLEQAWVSAAPRACSAVSPSVTNLTCGLASRFDSTLNTACALIPEVDTMVASYPADTEVTELDDYSAYVGNGRRVITVAVVEALATTDMTVLGFRQFLLLPNPNDVTINPADVNGRFAALYIGSVVPLRQGRFGGCQVAGGPGKVVLHQ